MRDNGGDMGNQTATLRERLGRANEAMSKGFALLHQIEEAIRGSRPEALLAAGVANASGAPDPGSVEGLAANLERELSEFVNRLDVIVGRL